MAYYDEDDNKKRNFTILGIICACLYMFFNHLFGYSETMTCGEHSCDIYKVKNSNKVPHLHKSFSEDDISGFDVDIIGSRRRRENTTYIPVVILKDGSRIKLNALETRDSHEARHTTFNLLRNRKFPR